MERCTCNKRGVRVQEPRDGGADAGYKSSDTRNNLSNWRKKRRRKTRRRRGSKKNKKTMDPHIVNFPSPTRESGAGLFHMMNECILLFAPSSSPFSCKCFLFSIIIIIISVASQGIETRSCFHHPSGRRDAYPACCNLKEDSDEEEVGANRQDHHYHQTKGNHDHDSFPTFPPLTPVWWPHADLADRKTSN